MQADDLMAAVFPDAAACLENIPGDREVPDHPLASQTIRDCLEEAMDLPGLTAVLSRIHAGELRLVARDTPEPSAFSHDIINARPYAFMDDAPLEERRARAVQTRRAGRREDDSGRSTPMRSRRVRDEVYPDPRDADELHDALLTTAFLLDDEIRNMKMSSAASALAAVGRATRVALPASSTGVWVAAERLPELLGVHRDAALEPHITAPVSRTIRTWAREEALVELTRGRLTILGPMTAEALAASLSVSVPDIDSALLALESAGVVLRGTFTSRRADT